MPGLAQIPHENHTNIQVAVQCETLPPKLQFLWFHNVIELFLAGFLGNCFLRRCYIIMTQTYDLVDHRSDLMSGLVVPFYVRTGFTLIPGLVQQR
jgi:hypothetical protein